MDKFLWLSELGVIGAIASGALAGVFGLGGGIVIVPVLYEIFGWTGVTDSARLQLSAGTSLAIVAPTTLIAGVVRRRSRPSAPFAWPSVAAPVTAGVFAGCFVAGAAPAWLFKASYLAAFLVLVGAKQLFQRLAVRPTATETTEFARWKLGLLTGFVGTLAGSGGAPLTTILMMKSRQLIYEVFADSTQIIVLIGAAGAFGYGFVGFHARSTLTSTSIGFVSLIAAVMVPFVVAAAPLGARFGRRIPEQAKDRALALFALIVVVQMLARI